MTTSDVNILHSRAAQLLDEGDLDGALGALSDVPAEERDAAIEGLLGLICLRRQEYDAAATHYKRACELQPDEREWSHGLVVATAGTESMLNTFVPEKIFFERDTLLMPPVLPPNALPTPPRPISRPLRSRVRIKLGNGLGLVASHIMGGATWLVGRVFGIHDEVWTSWYRRRFVIGVLTLAYMREQLNRNNLKDTYPPGSLVGFVDGDLEPPPGATHFRTSDGSWNNLANPKEGAAGTRFPRNVDNTKVQPEGPDTLLSPNPREISRKLFARDGEMKEIPFLNLLAASWIQFQNHDWISHGENLERDLIEIPLAEDDPARIRYRQRAMFIGRTQPDPTRREQGETTPVTFINEVTHWWDGSQIYGSDQATVDRLRSHVGGKLRLTEEGLLPRRNGIEDSGMVRNWWVGLSMLHTLFAREHNAICDHLAEAYPDWDDDRLFNVARLINAAVTAKIHSVEWTPAVLPNEVLSAGLHSNWYGLLTTLLRSGSQRKTVADINVVNPELGGVVGNPINRHGAPYGLTQEFVEVYRLHSFLPEEFKLRRHEDGSEIETLPFPRARQAGSAKLLDRVSMTDLFYSFGNQHPGQLVLNNYPRFMQEFSIPGNPLFDMGALDIVRARERGVPRYNEFRRQLGLRPLRRVEDLTDDQDVVRRIKEIYGDRPEDVERIDLLVGTLAEGHRPTGFGFGETLFQIFILNASRRLQADRFYTDSYNEETYTREGLEWIDRADLKSVILRHYPELAGSGLANVKNAFEPWDSGRLTPDRHPLRAFDRDLRADPWRGDAVRFRQSSDHDPRDSVAISPDRGTTT
jgi:hypothetical protein